MHTKEFYEYIRQKINISDVIRKKVNVVHKGGEYIGLCPFHQEKTPSFTATDIKRFYHCFGCKATGDVINFVSHIQSIPYKDAAIILANEYGIPIPKFNKDEELLYGEEEEILQLLSKACEFFQSKLTATTKKYLLDRGITSEIIRDFNIGFAPSGNHLLEFFNNKVLLDSLLKSGLINKREDGSIYEIFHNRIIFPIKNKYNKIIGFGGRVLDNKLPKYLNSPETIVFKKNKVIYGINHALSSIYKKNYVILVEGYLDVMALHQHGFNMTVASMGTAVNKNQLLELWNYCDEIIACLDGDSAGKIASKKIIDTAISLVNEQKTVSFITLPNNSDPHDYIINNGKEEFNKLIQNKLSFANMIWQLELNENQINTPEDRAKLTYKLEKHTKLLTNNTLKYNYNKFFKDQLWQQQKHYYKSNNSTTSVNLLKQKLVKNSEIELLEFSLLSFLINHPEILKINEIKQFFETNNFINYELYQLSEFILIEFSKNFGLTQEIIKENIKNTGFYQTYTLLLSNSYLSIPSSSKVLDHVSEWEILKTKHYLALLKEEYHSIMNLSSDTNYDFEKENNYRKEIIKTTEQLRQITENLFNQ